MQSFSEKRVVSGQMNIQSNGTVFQQLRLSQGRKEPSTCFPHFSSFKLNHVQELCPKATSRHMQCASDTTFSFVTKLSPLRETKPVSWCCLVLLRDNLVMCLFWSSHTLEFGHLCLKTIKQKQKFPVVSGSVARGRLDCEDVFAYLTCDPTQLAFDTMSTNPALRARDAHA